MEGTHAPSPFEQLWERYRSLITVVIAAVLIALVGQWAWARYEQSQSDAKWSSFAASLGLEDNYVDSDGSDAAGHALTEDLAGIDMASLESNLASADDTLKPFYLMAIARKAMTDSNWERATKALDDLESGYPEHSLVKSSKIPVQSRAVEKPDEDIPVNQRKVEWKPAKEGSAVSLMREQIASTKEFVVPSAYDKPEIPADAPKVKFTLGDMGSFTIALMKKEAPLHTEAFLKLAAEGYWKDVAVDEIQRGTDLFDLPLSLHLGYESTKDEDRSKWTTTEPSEHLVDWEETKLSHFEGAVAGRPEKDGKSCANRLWFCVDDGAQNDDRRVVFGYVVEGLDVLRTVCEAGLSAQDEDRGMGRPEEDIRVTAVEVL